MEETISLKEIFAVLKKRLGLIIAITVVAAGISAIISFFVITPTYQSNAQFIVNQDTNAESSTVDINQIRSNVEIINTYNQIIVSRRILDQVVEELDLPYSSGTLASQVAVSSQQNSQVVNLTVTNEDPYLAADIANKTIEVFQEEVPVLLNVNNVSVLAEAVTGANPSPVNPKPMLNIAIAIVVGLMAGVGLAFLLEYLDNTIKTEQDIEDKLGLPILGVVAHVTDEEMSRAHISRAQVSNVKRERGNINGAKKKTV
ncbi:YveK family protein [Gracilibacillus marinus]|uniref:YveK family protein n=1 Tax=Gracilibacillus marinus TaxID=630535 RepID=A0ABV8VTR7_9BACI